MCIDSLEFSKKNQMLEFLQNQIIIDMISLICIIIKKISISLCSRKEIFFFVYRCLHAFVFHFPEFSCTTCETYIHILQILNLEICNRKYNFYFLFQTIFFLVSFTRFSGNIFNTATIFFFF